MTILVTGGAGRLGLALSEQLVDHGYKIKVFDIPTADFTPYIDRESIEIVKGDIRNPNDLREAIKDITSVFHLAAILPPKSEENPELTHNINVHGTQNIVRVIKELPENIPLFFSSSVMVYGNTSSELPPINEDHATHAIDIYSESKIKSEQIIRNSNMSYTILRISGIYAVELMELPEVIPFRAEQRVNFIDRRDVVRALVSALESTRTTNQVINIAGDNSWWLTGIEFITKIYNALGVHIEASYSTRYTSFDWYDTTSSQSLLNYQNIPFSQFIKEMEDLGKNLF